MREVERRGCWPPVQPSHLRFHEPFFSFLSFFSSPLPKVRFLLCLLCNRGLAGCQEHVEWKCEVKLAFAEGERLSTLPRPACPYQLRGSLSPSLRHSLSFFLELVSGAPSAFNAATIGHRGGKASKRSFAFPDAFCSRPSLSEPPLPLPVPLSRQTRHFHSFSSSNSKFRNWTAVSFTDDKWNFSSTLEISAFGSMNGGEFSPATTTFLGKSFFFVSGIATKELFVTCVTRFRVFAA